MELFFERHKLPKITQEETDNFNFTSIKSIEFIFKNLPTSKTLGPDGFIFKFNQIFKKEILQNLHKLFQKTEEMGTTFQLIL